MARVSPSPSVLRWARTRVGVDTEHVASKFAVEAWERGERQPTLRQLREYARATHTPLGTFFMPEPPSDVLPIDDFRTLGNRVPARPSTNLLDTVEACQLRQSWYRTFALESGAESVPFVGSATLRDDPERSAERVRDAVGLDVTARADMPRWSDAFRAFVRLVETAGVLVMVSGIVGSNARRTLDEEEFRGFALADDLAPLVFVNGRSSTSVKTFTLAHELGHLALGASGVGAASIDAPSDDGQDVECWCNAFAGEFLVPIADFVAHVPDERPSPHELAETLAGRYKVSTLVIIRRLWDARWFATWQEYRDAYQSELERLAAHQRQGGGGGDFTRAHIARLGNRFLSALAVSTGEGRTPLREAMTLAGVARPSTFETLSRAVGVAP